MSKIQEKLEEVLRADNPTDCLTHIHEALAQLEAESEPEEFTAECREYNFFDAEHSATAKVIGFMNRLREACDIIDSQTASCKIFEIMIKESLAELKAKEEDLAAGKAEIERLNKQLVQCDDPAKRPKSRSRQHFSASIASDFMRKR